MADLADRSQVDGQGEGHIGQDQLPDPGADARIEQSISADEIALYDRQIRLWGVQAQEKIRTANILIMGMNAVGNEVAKNLVLAGVGFLTMVDDAIVTEDDLGACFLLSEADVGKNRAEACLERLRQLNPRVTISAYALSPIALTPDLFMPYTVTVANSLPYPALTQLNLQARFVNRPFYATGIHGLYGYIFADLIQHDYVIERERSNVPLQPGATESSTRSIVSVAAKPSTGDGGHPKELVTKREVYSPLQLANTSPLPASITSNRRRLRAVPPLLTCLRALWEFEGNWSPTVSPPNLSNPTELSTFTKLTREKHQELMLPMETLKGDFLKSFLQNLCAELSPTAAWIGGQLAQDIINVLGAREQPIQNLVLFDGDEMKGPIYAMHPVFDGAALNGAMAGGAAVQTANGDGQVQQPPAEHPMPPQEQPPQPEQPQQPQEVN